MRNLILFAASASLAVTTLAAEPWPRKIKPVMVWAGTSGNPAEVSFHRCCSQQEWDALWRKHQGGDKHLLGPDCPEVDFDSYMVVAVFQGESLKNLGVQFFGVVEEDQYIHVRYRPPTWQTGFDAGAATIAEEKDKASNEFKYDPQSYAFIVLPKSRKAIVFDEDVRGVLDAPPVWKETAKLPAIERK